MHASQFKLLKTKKFLPLFLTQFLGAFNDNVFKNAMVILITFRAAEASGLNVQMMVTMAAGIFILPFFLFSAIGGELADKYDRAFLIRRIKFTEIIIMILGSIAFYFEHVMALMAILFMMGSQSAFFGPLKYSILPDHLKKKELIGGNALVNASTFIAILLGTIFGGLLILADGGIIIISASVISFALLGWLISQYIPKTVPASPGIRISRNIYKQTVKILGYIKRNNIILISILGISWFWFVGATFLAQFPNYGKLVIGGNEQVVTLFLAAFSIGIAAGALLCNRILKGSIDTRYVPLGALGISLFTLDLFWISGDLALPWKDLIGVSEFFRRADYVRIFFDLVMISISGGIYIVPLYAKIQAECEAKHRARTIAATNVLNALFMVVSALFTLVMFAYEFAVTDVFLVVAIINLIVAFQLKKNM